MNRKTHFTVGLILLISFALWTCAVCFVDIRPIGPGGSSVGLATLNGYVHRLTGAHMALYHITDWLGLIPFMFVSGFGLLGLGQWIRRKSLYKVDRSLLALGGFYISVMTAYMLFEVFPVNYRPVLIGGILEASYPSSTTMLVMCVMPTAVFQLNRRIRSIPLRRCTAAAITAYTAFMVLGRLISGVHWFSDIIGGMLLSAGLVMLYHSIVHK